jgi:hypothetical protein
MGNEGVKLHGLRPAKIIAGWDFSRGHRFFVLDRYPLPDLELPLFDELPPSGLIQGSALEKLLSNTEFDLYDFGNGNLAICVEGTALTFYFPSAGRSAPAEALSAPAPEAAAPAPDEDERIPF